QADEQAKRDARESTRGERLSLRNKEASDQGSDIDENEQVEAEAGDIGAEIGICNGERGKRRHDEVKPRIALVERGGGAAGGGDGSRQHILKQVSEFRRQCEIGEEMRIE